MESKNLRVYGSVKDYDLPDIDLLSLIFDSPICDAREDTVLHAEAARPINGITKAEARYYVQSIAWQLRNIYGVGRNKSDDDVVTCVCSGQIFLPIIFYAVLAAGGIYSAASTSFNPDELSRQIKQSGSRLIIASPDCVEVAVETAKRCNILPKRLLILDTMGTTRSLQDHTKSRPNLICEGQNKNTSLLPWERLTDRTELRNRTICLLFSSGTTGVPKGVKISHTNLVHPAVIAHYLLRDWKVRQRILDPNFSFAYRTLAHLPAAHIAGLQGYAVNPAISGGTTLWMPKFNFEDFLAFNKTLQITYFFSVPPIFLRISKSPSATETHFKSLVHAVSGAAPLGFELQLQAQRKLGCRIAQTWGLTETTGSVTSLPWDEYDDSGSVSPLMPNTRLRIIDEDDVDVAGGEEGEFVVQGPQVVTGYWKNGGATFDLFTRDGQWLKTGDVGACRDGKFYIMDRKKEMIKYNGLQVAPAELEAVLISHDNILDVAVIGVPDPMGSSNELPRAYIVAVDAAGLTGADVKGLIKSRLASHKQLRGGVVFCKEIPKSASGKILRRQLREQAKRRDELAKL